MAYWDVSSHLSKSVIFMVSVLLSQFTKCHAMLSVTSAKCSVSLKLRTTGTVSLGNTITHALST
jgi:hypothetical protein